MSAWSVELPRHLELEAETVLVRGRRVHILLHDTDDQAILGGVDVRFDDVLQFSWCPRGEEPDLPPVNTVVRSTAPSGALRRAVRSNAELGMAEVLTYRFQMVRERGVYSVEASGVSVDEFADAVAVRVASICDDRVWPAG